MTFYIFTCVFSKIKKKNPQACNNDMPLPSPNKRVCWFLQALLYWASCIGICKGFKQTHFCILLYSIVLAPSPPLYGFFYVVSWFLLYYFLFAFVSSDFVVLGFLCKVSVGNLNQINFVGFFCIVLSPCVCFFRFCYVELLCIICRASKTNQFFVVVNEGQRNNMHFFLFLLWFNMHVAWRTKF